MPIPQRKKNEKQNDYMGRCMTSLKEDDMPQKQKVAICLNSFRNPKKAKASCIEVDINSPSLDSNECPECRGIIEIDISETEAYQKIYLRKK